MAPLDTLTDRQREIYDFVREKIVNRGYGPTVREIGTSFGIKSPNGVMCHLKALEKKGLINREANMSRAIQLSEGPSRKAALPLLGRVVAGQPLATVEQSDEVDFSTLFETDQQFCLEVHGDSMIDAHITEGDFVIVKKQKAARDRDIVVALVDGEETTLKRFFKEANRIRLQPENSTMKPFYPQQLDILGIVVGVVRQY